MSKKSPEDQEHQLMLAWLEDHSLTASERYLNAGRAHRNLSLEDLERAWVAAFRAKVANYTNSTARACDDLEAEMRARDLKPNFDLVSDEFKALMEITTRALERLKTEDPERFREANDELQADLDDFTKNAKSGH